MDEDFPANKPTGQLMGEVKIMIKAIGKAF
jgi:hypothetical protein